MCPHGSVDVGKPSKQLPYTPVSAHLQVLSSVVDKVQVFLQDEAAWCMWSQQNS